MGELPKTQNDGRKEAEIILGDTDEEQKAVAADRNPSGGASEAMAK